MDAPVYRHADTRATLLGLNFPGDFFAVVVVGYLWLVLLPPLGFLLATSGTHGAIAVLNRGKPPQHWAHWLGFHLRLGRNFQRLETNLLAAGEPVALGPGDSVNEHLSSGDEPLRGGAGTDRRLLGEEAIQPQPRGDLGYAKRDQGRSVDAPCRRRGLRSPASIVPTTPSWAKRAG